MQTSSPPHVHAKDMAGPDAISDGSCCISLQDNSDLLMSCDHRFEFKLAPRQACWPRLAKWDACEILFTIPLPFEASARVSSLGMRILAAYNRHLKAVTNRVSHMQAAADKVRNPSAGATECQLPCSSLGPGK